MRYLLALLLVLCVGCSPTPLPVPAFSEGQRVEVRVDGRVGVTVRVADPRIPSYTVRLHSNIIGYRVIVFRETELRHAK